jgi:hypothetical protein
MGKNHPHCMTFLLNIRRTPFAVTERERGKWVSARAGIGIGRKGEPLKATHTPHPLSLYLNRTERGPATATSKCSGMA